MSRRAFLRRVGWTAGGLTVLSTSGCSLIPPLPTFAVTDQEDALSWVKITPGGQVEFLIPRAEMGQGIDTGLAQIVAEELRVPMAHIHCLYQHTDAMAPCQMTAGSQSIENYAGLTAHAAAMLRQTLVERAASKLQLEPDSLLLNDGFVVIPTGERHGYGYFVASGEDAILTVDSQSDRVELYSQRDTSELRVVGKSVTTQHVERIVTGTETFSRDVQLENMLFGAVAHAAQVGAHMSGFDRDAAEAVDGVIAVVTGPDDDIGLIASTPMALTHGMTALNVQWAPLEESVRRC